MLAVTASARGAGTDGTAPAVSIVPQPRSLRVGAGSYVWPRHVRIAVRDPHVRAVAARLRAYLAANGVTATVAGDGRATAAVVLQSARRYDAQLGDEGYALRVADAGVSVRANTPRGMFYALQTLEQVSARAHGRFTSRAVIVADRPEYRWRGIHLDVARHFFVVPVVERYIDLAAHFKLNVFHWHLTDDQAWRLDIPRYPALTAGREHYSAADVRRVVAYAAHRYVTVVPELEMPAHADAALHAYPRLKCGQRTLCTHGAGLVFARAVLAAAMDVFPSPYLHAGGDEVPAPASLAQFAFTREIERYVESRGRRLVGWDEIFTPQLSPRAVVMVWTARRRAAQAARHGNDVVLSSGALYFDGAQGDPAQEPRASPHMSTLEQVYDYGMAPAGLSPSAAAHVLGAQANVWTEHIATPQRLFAMVLPRELALAEIAWTPRAHKDWPSFLARLPAQFAWLEAHRYDFRIPNASFAVTGGLARFEAVPGHVQAVRAWTTAPAVTVALSVPLAGAVIRYTTNAARPSAASPAYRGPFTVRAGRVPVVLRAAAFLHGRAGGVTECAVARVSPAALRAHRSASRSWSSLVSP